MVVPERCNKKIIADIEAVVKYILQIGEGSGTTTGKVVTGAPSL